MSNVLKVTGSIVGLAILGFISLVSGLLFAFVFLVIAGMFNLSDFGGEIAAIVGFIFGILVVIGTIGFAGLFSKEWLNER